MGPDSEDIVDVTFPHDGLQGAGGEVLCFKVVHEEVGQCGGDQCAHGCAMYLLLEITGEGENVVSKDKG